MEEKITLTAHRGYRQKFPENTMRSFREALKLDIDSIEMDVRMTADGEIVVIHDQTLDRTTDKKGHICDLTLHVYIITMSQHDCRSMSHGPLNL